MEYSASRIVSKMLMELDYPEVWESFYAGWKNDEKEICQPRPAFERLFKRLGDFDRTLLELAISEAFMMGWEFGGEIERQTARKREDLND